MRLETKKFTLTVSGGFLWVIFQIIREILR